MSRTLKGSFWPLLMGLALVTLLLAVSCGGASGEKGAAEGPSGEEPGGDQASVEGSEAPPEGAALEHPSLGEDDAPVVLVEYADYQ